MMRSPRAALLALAAFVLFAGGTAGARQYLNSGGGGTVSPGVVPEVNDAAVTSANPLPVSVVSGGGGSGTPETRTTSGAIQPPTAAAGKITRTSTALTANTSTTIAAANANRIALGIQCGSGGVSVDEAGGALTAAGVGNGTLFIPTGAGPYFTPPIATLTAITAYTASAQTCVVTEYLR